jgi:AraC-like DNA-binding protein
MTYESWNCDLPVHLPRRSHFYQLRPLGVGTPLVESLTGYVCRLAVAHCVSPSVLIRREILPRLRESNDPSGAKASTFIYDSYILNGVGDCPRAWVRILENLTGEGSLHVMTMLPWARLLSYRHLLRENRRWCPRCFETWRGNCLPLYEPLLWSLQAATVCPLHAGRLEEHCPHCGKTSKALTARALPGCCYHCRGWLGAPLLYAARPSVNDDDLKLAHAAGDLLARSSSLTETVSPGHIKNNLRRCVDDLAAGNLSHFARLSGLSFDSISSWLVPSRSFSLDSFLRLCCHLELPAARFASEDMPLDDPGWVRARQFVQQRPSWSPQRKPLYGPHPSPRSEGTSVEERPRSYLRRKFQRALSSEAPWALQALALDLGFRYSSALYHRFPELCQALARKNRRWRESEDDKIRHTLSQAATENPPPSMKDIAARLGYSVTALRARFPEQSAALTARKPESRLLEKERMRARLEAALLDRPTSLMDVAESVGRSTGHLRSLFPQLWRRISARYAEAKKQAAVQARLRFCAEIRSAVMGLHESGIHPSRKRVFAAIPEPSMRCSHTLDRQIAETLRELTTPSASPLS